MVCRNVLVLLSLSIPSFVIAGELPFYAFLAQAREQFAQATDQQVLGERMMLDCLITDQQVEDSGQDCPAGHARVLSQVLREMHRHPINAVFFRGKGTTARLKECRDRIVHEFPNRQIWFGIDAEYGVGMRLSDVEAFPCNRELAESDNSAERVAACAKATAQQLKQLGIHYTPVPVVDITDEGFLKRRSYSNDPSTVYQLGKIALKSFIENGIVAGPKHFPGHGDAKKLGSTVNANSHTELPYVNKTMKELCARELFPYLMLADAPTLMTGHIMVPSIDSQRPITLSNKARGLAELFDFKGIIVTDALDMGAIKETGASYVDANMQALQAADILLMPQQLFETMYEASILLMASPDAREEARERAIRIRALKLWSFHQFGKKLAD